MIDLHSHTFFSDGDLSPSELVRRAYMQGYKVLGITDHADFSNYEMIFTSIDRFIRNILDCGWDIKVIPGIEITHVPAKKIESLVQKARDLKIPLIVVHGESPVEPVEKGTNRAAIESCVDIVAHPGLITDDDAKLAAKNRVNLEITSRRGHSLTNGHVAKTALKYGSPLVLNTDSHSPSDLFKPEMRNTVLLGCGIESGGINGIEKNIQDTAAAILKKYGIWQ